MSPQLVLFVVRAGAAPVSGGLSRRPSGRAVGLGTASQPVGTAAPPGGGRTVVVVLDGLLEPQPARARRTRRATRERIGAGAYGAGSAPRPWPVAGLRRPSAGAPPALPSMRMRRIALLVNPSAGG